MGNLDRLNLFLTDREEIPLHIQRKAVEEAKAKLGENIGNHKMQVGYAVKGDLLKDPKTQWILGITDEIIGSKDQKEIYVGPNMTTSWSGEVATILDKCGVDKGGKVEKIIYHTYDTDIKNPEEKLGTVWHNELTQKIVSDYSEIGDFFKTGEKRYDNILDLKNGGIESLIKYNEEHKLGMYPELITHFYKLLTEKYKINPTQSLTYILAYLNSEHNNHHIWGSKHIINGKKIDETFFQLIKNTHKNNPGNTILAYSDDASIMRGPSAITKNVNKEGIVKYEETPLNTTLKVETHNHPSFIEPYQGAKTGVGGVERDGHLVALGGQTDRLIEMFITSDLSDNQASRIPYGHASALDIITKGPEGAKDYANPFGTPLGIFDHISFETVINGQYYGFDKPGMLAGVQGSIYPENSIEKEVPVGSSIYYVGADNNMVGMGGSVGSSTEGANSKGEKELNIQEVQRGEPIIGAANKDFFEKLIMMKENNPVAKQSDVGASGFISSTIECLEDIGKGAKLYMSKVPVADKSMADFEKLVNETQERNIIIILKKDEDKFEQLAKDSGSKVYNIGEITDGTDLVIYNDDGTEKIVNIDVNDILGHDVELVIEDETVKINGGDILYEKIDLANYLREVISHPTVGDKSCHISQKDQTVGGKTILGPVIGPFQTAIGSVAITMHGLEGIKGNILTTTARPEISILDPGASVRMTVAEAIIKSVTTGYITDFDSFGGSGNWLIARNHKGQIAATHEMHKALEKITDELGFDINVGKDSNGMKAESQENVVSPSTLVLSLLSQTSDTGKILTPEFKNVKDSELFLIDFANGKQRMGGSILAQIHNKIEQGDHYGNEVPDIDNPEDITNFSKAMIELHEKTLLLASHNKVKGGLFRTISEMSFASHIGVDIDIKSLTKNNSNENFVKTLLNDELGVIFQFETSKKQEILEILKKYNLEHLGHSIGKLNHKEQNIGFSYNGKEIINEKRVDLQEAWSSTGLKIKNHSEHNNPRTTKAEFDRIRKGEYEPPMKEILTFDVKKHPALSIIKYYKENNLQDPKAAILKTVGTNSQDELERYYTRGGFEAVSIHINEWLDGRHELTNDNFSALSPAGGYGHGDALGAGVGLAQIILNNPRTRKQVQEFDGLLFGNCNGYQTFMELSEILKGGESFPKLVENESGKFEARTSLVKIEENKNSIFLKGMGGSLLKSINSHHQGKVLGGNVKHGIKFADNNGNTTEEYPYNPNGSKGGGTGFEYEDTFCTMGHPERPNEEDSAWLQIILNMRLEVEKRAGDPHGLIEKLKNSNKY